MPSCSRPSRTLRAAEAVARRRAILDRRCARRQIPRADRDERMVPIEQKDWTEEERASKPGHNHQLDSTKRQSFQCAGLAIDDRRISEIRGRFAPGTPSIRWPRRLTFRRSKDSDCLFVVVVEHVATPGEHERCRCHHHRCHQSIPPSKSAAKTANHAPDAAVQRRSHRICRMLLDAFLPSVRKLCSRDIALWRVNTCSGFPGAGVNPCLERDNREFGLHFSSVPTSIDCSPATD